MKDPLLRALQENARLDDQSLAQRLGLAKEEVASKRQELESNGTIMGYQAVIDPDKTGETSVTAVIEVQVRPERGGGFDRMAERIARFDQVQSCYLMSGGYDLLVVVTGQDLREVSHFVAERLSTLEGVLSTATRFRLKTYKENHCLAIKEAEGERLAITP
ncbi:MAG: Lrp/AsnC family transcriptional regulator [Verrucomicrobiales bacterium]